MSQLATFLSRVSNAPAHEEKISFKLSDARIWAEEIAALQQNQCACEQPTGFEINTRNERVDFDCQLARMKRMRAEDEEFANARMP